MLERYPELSSKLLVISQQAYEQDLLGLLIASLHLLNQLHSFQTTLATKCVKEVELIVSSASRSALQSIIDPLWSAKCTLAMDCGRVSVVLNDLLRLCNSTEGYLDPTVQRILVSSGKVLLH